MDASRQELSRIVETVMQQYTIRDLPEDVWEKAHARARRERWPLPDVIRRLLEDYGNERVTPTGLRPADPVYQQYRPIFGAAFDEVSGAPDWGTLTDRERGQRLRAAMLKGDKDRPPRFPPDFDFTLVAKRLGMADPER